MVDLKKEIKLSDLVPRRRQKQSVTKTLASPGRSKRSARRELVGLKVGGSQLAASRVVNNGSASLVQVARRPLDRGIVVGGEVRDVQALAHALDSFFTEHNLPRRGVRLGLATRGIGVRAFDIDGIADERQLENAIRFRAHEAVSIPIEEAVLDYHVVSQTVDEHGNVSRRILLAAAYREPIERYVEVCRAAKIELAGIDLEAFALLRAIGPDASDPAKEAASAVVAVSLGHDRSTLAISDGAVCEFTRVLEWGGGMLESAIAVELKVAADEATELKLGVSLVGDTYEDSGEDPAEDPRQPAVRETVKGELQKLARELIASLQFYQSQPGSRAISHILVSGGTSLIPGLPEELEQLTRVDVRRADSLAHVQAADDVRSRDDLASLAVAIGLGMEA
ncbi:MAG: type IV pilus assembly protein PilM [Gaiellaceae bacterium MAG52_C11]|nr:type IV pilus assembly protein PilM [Candidatus Gaiellasilicea maunaloa]